MGLLPNNLDGIVETVLDGMGYEYVGAELRGQGRGSVLCIYIDHEAGIALDDCEAVSRQLSAVLDVEDVVPGSYTLEVSSPGWDRPLFKAEHYTRFAGHEVRIKMTHPVAGRRNYRGRIQGMEADDVVVVVDEQAVRLPLGEIERARLVPEY